MSTLHDDLRALAGDQPVQPADRLTSVRARSRRLRRTRAAVVVVAVLAVAAPTAVVVQQQHDGGSAPSAVAQADVTAWPDRSQPGDLAGYDGAVRAFEQSGGQGPVHWLYRGIVPVPDPNTPSQTALAVFRAERAGQPVVVQSRAWVPGTNPTSVGSPTDWASREAPVESVDDDLGLYLNYADTSLTVPLTSNVLFLLAAPTARQVAWVEQPIPEAPSGAARRGTIASQDGVFVQDLGALRGPVDLFVDDSTVPTGLLGAGGEDAEPRLVPPSAPDSPAGWRGDDVSGSGSAGPAQESTFVASGSSPTSQQEATVVLARCYGGGTVTVNAVANGLGSAAVGDVLASGRLDCDGSSQTVIDQHLEGLYTIELAPLDRLVSYAVAVGSIS